jgi:hypothetical protein
MNLQIRTTGTGASRAAPSMVGQAFQPAAGAEGNLYFESKGSVALFPSVVEDRVAAEFQLHERKWKQQTRHISSPVDKYLHPSYARIIGLGWPAVSLILKSLKKEPADWFYALRAITGANPVADSVAGDVRRMTDLWLKWGEKRGLL